MVAESAKSARESAPPVRDFSLFPVDFMGVFEPSAAQFFSLRRGYVPLVTPLAVWPEAHLWSTASADPRGPGVTGQRHAANL